MGLEVCVAFVAKLGLWFPLFCMQGEPGLTPDLLYRAAPTIMSQGQRGKTEEERPSVETCSRAPRMAAYSSTRAQVLGILCEGVMALSLQ